MNETEFFDFITKLGINLADAKKITDELEAEGYTPEEMTIDEIELNTTEGLGKVFMNPSHCVGITTKENQIFQEFMKINKYPEFWVEGDKYLLKRILNSTEKQGIRLKMKPGFPLFLKDEDSSDIWLLAPRVDEADITQSELGPDPEELLKEHIGTVENFKKIEVPQK